MHSNRFVRGAAMGFALVGALLGFCGADKKARGDEDNKALKQLRGSWTVTEGPRRFQAKRLVFAGDTLTYVFEGGETKRDKFTIDATAKPAHINLGYKDKASPGIYEINVSVYRELKLRLLPSAHPFTVELVQA